MDEAYGPAFAFLGTFVLLNLVQCVVGFRRIRVLERRVWVLENTAPEPHAQTQAPTQPTPQTTVSTYTNPNYTYAAPPISTYGYYQQASAPPQATPYYPQDPQVVTGRIY